MTLHDLNLIVEYAKANHLMDALFHQVVRAYLASKGTA